MSVICLFVFCFVVCLIFVSFVLFCFCVLFYFFVLFYFVLFFHSFVLFFVLLFFCSFVRTKIKISNLPFYRKFLSRYHMRIFVSWKAYSILRVASLAKSQIPFTLGCLLCSSRARLINLLHENYFHYNVI